jgi:hypothetical protein
MLLMMNQDVQYIYTLECRQLAVGGKACFIIELELFEKKLLLDIRNYKCILLICFSMFSADELEESKMLVV